jgi:sec-independent protein translocase protein TatA
MLSTIFSGTDDLIVVIVALVVLFGGAQLPKLARNTGEALREFRKSHSEAEAAGSAVSAPGAVTAAPANTAPAATTARPALPTPAQVATTDQAPAPGARTA